MEVYDNISAQSVRNMIEYELRDYELDRITTDITVISGITNEIKLLSI